MKTLQILFILSISTATLFAQTATFTYKETTGDTVRTNTASQTQAGDTLIVEARQHQFLVRNVLDASGNSYSWHMESTDGKSNIDAALKDGKIRVRGVFNRKKVDKTVTPDPLNPWSQDFTAKIHALCQSHRKSTLISAFNPMDFSLMQFEAVDKGVETVQVNGKNVEARHMRIGLTGILALAWHGDYWFRKSDCRFVRYEGTNGPPGSPKTTIELVEEK